MGIFYFGGGNHVRLCRGASINQGLTKVVLCPAPLIRGKIKGITLDGACRAHHPRAHGAHPGACRHQHVHASTPAHRRTHRLLLVGRCSQLHAAYHRIGELVVHGSVPNRRIRCRSCSSLPPHDATTPSMDPRTAPFGAAAPHAGEEGRHGQGSIMGVEGSEREKRGRMRKSSLAVIYENP